MIRKISKFQDYRTFLGFDLSTISPIFPLVAMIAIHYSLNFPMPKVKDFKGFCKGWVSSVNSLWDHNMFYKFWFFKILFLVKENSLKRKRCSNQSPSKKRSRTQSVSRNKRWFKVAFIVTRLNRTTTPEPKIKRYITADDISKAREYPSYQIIYRNTITYFTNHSNSSKAV